MPLQSAEDRAASRPVLPEDVFFSTTDAKGVITHANDTFLRLAAMTEGDAIGRPHNVIRHPEMPGAAFHLVWDELEAGRPVCAYIANRARDGARYDVLATIAPIADGYLSIRLRPGVEELQGWVLEAYDEVAAAEDRHRSMGGTRSAVAERGADRLAAALAEHGYATVADFTRAVLPREIEALLRDLPPIDPDTTRRGALGVVLQAAEEIGRVVEPFAGRLRDFEQLAEQISAERAAVTPAIAQVAGVRRDLHALAGLLRDAAQPAADQPAAADRPATDAAGELAELTDRLAGFAGEAVDRLETVPVRLTELQRHLRDLALRISMLVLMDTMVSRFTAEVISSGEARGTELRLLAGALEHGLAQVEEETAIVTHLLRQIPELVEAGVRGTDRVTLRLDGWAARVTAAVSSGELGNRRGDVVALRDAVLAATRDRFLALTPIVGLSARLRQTPVRFELDEALVQLALVRGGVADLA
ncbi:PAS domain-containing protein [Salana multivorans]|uniref:PAS domain-containing protein n=1 Tax=Salana multivorans TaxID=120377 RepID=UPI0024917333|nr:PAS domain-containing protein [Salana multivorans]